MYVQYLQQKQTTTRTATTTENWKQQQHYTTEGGSGGSCGMTVAIAVPVDIENRYDNKFAMTGEIAITTTLKRLWEEKEQNQQICSKDYNNNNISNG